MIIRWRYCLYYIYAVMITRLRYCLNAVLITTVITINKLWHYCIRVEMVTGWVHWIVNVFNGK